MVTFLDKAGSAEALAQFLASAQSDPNIAGLMILAADGNGFAPEVLDPILQQVTKPLFGAIFPAIIHGGQTLTIGTLVIGLPVAPRIVTIRELSRLALPRDLLEELGEPNGAPGTAFMWLDSFSQAADALLDVFYNHFGPALRLLGGGAGSLDMRRKPCIISNAGLLDDAAVIAVLDLPSGIAARHGWVKLAGPYHVTESEKNVIHSLNWRPAATVYSAVVSSVAGEMPPPDRFYEVSRNFPFGLQRYGVERIVRDPFLVDGNSLICVGDVPQGSLVDILTGSKESLLVAADEALMIAESRLAAHGRATTLFLVDCVSRMLFLDDHFAGELALMNMPGVEMVGALTLGEIAGTGRDYPVFYNKTAVVGVFDR